MSLSRLSSSREHNRSPCGNPQEYKVIILGDQGTGKTSLVTRFLTDSFVEAYKATVGIDFVSSPIMNVNGTTFRLTLWDTAGQENYRSVVQSYFRDCFAAIVVYDVTRPETLQHTGQWVSDVRLNASSGRENAKIFLVGNKTDLDESREVSTAEGEEKAKESNATFTETSAKVGENVKTLFELIIGEVVQQVHANPSLPSPEVEDRIVLSNDQNKRQIRRKHCSC